MADPGCGEPGGGGAHPSKQCRIKLVRGRGGGGIDKPKKKKKKKKPRHSAGPVAYPTFATRLIPGTASSQACGQACGGCVTQ